MSFGWHVALRAVDERVLALDDVDRRKFAVAVKRAGASTGLFAFGLGDDHGHAAVAAANPTAFCRSATLTLRSALGFPVHARVLRPIRDLRHAEALVAYVHRQDLHHGLGRDPFREATSLPDLFGLRPDGLWLADSLRAVVPRITRADLLDHWGIDAVPELDGLHGLAQAGARAAGVASLDERSAPVVAARHACVAAAGTVDTDRIADELGVAERTVRRMRATPPDPTWRRAVRRQLGLASVVAVPCRGFEDDARPARGAPSRS